MQSSRARALMGFIFFVLIVAPIANASVFTVNSPADISDSSPGDSICETATGNRVCTLRAAIMESNYKPGSDTINLQDNVTYLLTQSPASALYITDSVSIVGAGVDRTIIDGNNGIMFGSVISTAICLGGSVCDVDHPQNIVRISNLTIRNGGVHDVGAGIYNQADLTIDRCKITHNISYKYGAGIYNAGHLLVNDSTISENDTGASPGKGGGVASFGTTIIRNSTISANVALYGGGIYSDYGTVSVINSTVSGNYAKANGGGIASFYGTTGLFSSTVAFNQANADAAETNAFGGGVFVGPNGTLTALNSIIAPNEYGKTVGSFSELVPDDCAGTITSQGNNILEFVDPSHCTIAGIVNITDPQLGPLQDNGGPTQTQALAFTSPAIGAGNIGGCTDNLGAILTTDQRGIHRPSGKYCDIGAFESTEAIFANGFEL
jgi:CSLREA domain-containing protein